MFTRLRVYGAAIGAAAAVLYVTGPSAVLETQAAVEGCPHSRDSFFSGAHTEPALAIFGSKARIEHRYPDICGPTSLSTAWAMVVGGRQTDGYAQVGYGKFGDSLKYDPTISGYGFRVFTQWSTTSPHETGTPPTWLGPSPSGAASDYAVRWQDGDNHLHLYIDGNEVGETSWDPLDFWADEWESQFVGETWHRGSDVVGTTSDTTRFSNLQRWHISGPWIDIRNIKLTPDPDGNPDDRYPARYHRQFVNPDVSTDFRIWTNPLESF